MSTRDEFPDVIQTAKWRLGIAETYCRLLIEKANREGLNSNVAMTDKINAAKYELKQRAEQYTAAVSNHKGC